MRLSGKRIIEEKIITNVTPKAIQPQGVDVRVKEIREVIGTGQVTVDATYLPKYHLVEVSTGVFGDKYYTLLPGKCYEVVLMEGFDIPNGRALDFKTRSSLVRCGAIVESGQFDAGFKTKNGGCFIYVTNRIKIEVGARIAQAIVTETDLSEDLYDGQWQGDKQRKS